jgi:hypothetical protein
MPPELPLAVQRARTGALITIAALTAAAALASFAESYRGLLDWALAHSLPLGWAIVAPLMVDVFVAVGELSLFVLVLDGFGWQQRIPAWLISIVGLAASIAGNAGHVWTLSIATRVTAAVPPVAAAAALAVALGLLKRIMAGPGQHRTAGQLAVPDTTAPVTVAEPVTLPDIVEPDSTGQPDTTTVAVPDTATPDSEPDTAAVVVRDAAVSVDLRVRAVELLTAEPGMSGAALGRALDVSDRTGRRIIAALSNGSRP